MKRLKIMGTMVIIFVVLMLILGIVFTNAAESCKGATVITTNGYKGTLGGNKRGQETFTAMSIMMYALSVIWGIVAVIMFMRLSAIKKQPVCSMAGRILEKENYIITVEFANGVRRKMTVEPDVFLTQGEEGEILYKDKAGIVVGFSRL